MDKIDKLLIGIAIGAVGFVFAMLSLALYIIWKAVIGA